MPDGTSDERKIMTLNCDLARKREYDTHLGVELQDSICNSCATTQIDFLTSL